MLGIFLSLYIYIYQVLQPLLRNLIYRQANACCHRLAAAGLGKAPAPVEGAGSRAQPWLCWVVGSGVGPHKPSQPQFR